MSDRPSMDDDDLARAYARAHALRDDAAGPSASVRANVLAAAQAVAAAQRAATDARPPLVPVAGPVADVGGERADAPNFSSWRVRSGAALCTLLVVGFALWRFDATHHYGGTQVAAADSAIEAKTLQEAPRSPAEPGVLPPPREALPPPPKYAPPAVVADAAEPTVVIVPPAAVAREHERDKDVVVAQSDNLVRPPTLDYRPPSAMAAPAPAAQPAIQPAAAAPAAAAAAVAPPVVVAAAAPPAEEPRLARAEARAAAPAMAPMAPAPVSPGDETLQRVEITGGPVDRPSGQGTASLADRKAKEAPMASAMGAPPRAPGTSLHAAAGAGDVEALRRLLADPATRVDAPDGLGRTALMVAVSTRHAAAVRLLLAAGADPERADASGATPRSVARTGASAEIAALLGVRR